MNQVISMMLIVVAVIHLLPVSGVISGERLSTLYGLSFDEANIEILMRHMAVLYGIPGVFILYSAFRLIYYLPGQCCFVSVDSLVSG